MIVQTNDWRTIDEFKAASKDYLHLGPVEGLSAFLESVSLVSDVDSMEEKPDLLTLITLHQAKGLEYPIVFMVGMEDGLLPHSRSMDEPASLEEERRLCYVGMTRAKDRLVPVQGLQTRVQRRNRTQLTVPVPAGHSQRANLPTRRTGPLQRR